MPIILLPKAVSHGDEVVALYKTQAAHWETICSVITDIHPYDEPCVLKIQAEAVAGFGDWVRRETSPVADAEDKIVR